MKKILYILFLLIFSIIIFLSIGFGVKVDIFNSGYLFLEKDKYLITTIKDLEKKKIFIEYNSILYESKCEYIQSKENMHVYSVLTHLVLENKFQQISFSLEKISLFYYVLRKE